MQSVSPFLEVKYDEGKKRKERKERKEEKMRKQ
jgi:hypothetical protein